MELHLNSVYRNVSGEHYSKFVDDLLRGEFPEFPGDYYFKFFDEIEKMLEDLQGVMRRKKIALVAYFTKSDGRKDRVRVDSPRIEWLMYENTEYRPYWNYGRHSLSKCASVHGSQGFESDYVGVIWVDELVWRDGKWPVNPGKIRDDVGGRNWPKNLALRNPERARQLPINHYRILLTSGIEGTCVFAEDKINA